ncbi:ligand-binding sensor domain-containing diguanylate cyclase [Pseudoxanthomonas koreensis]|uniref:ligand-binding sensor domain-containing diguanylate cyclase n=1 Tax=Pseudoxanthomonas koreensis TaxID=266061 RepID=UPI001391557E|nr:ligand-binding sensor domain-containing diguanylate cyclase [Pseudoxanthomonas koreensis]KAF1696642.1 GGDEF domain-containing protein [Pseudoxanthomonas koreensis]
MRVRALLRAAAARAACACALAWGLATPALALQADKAFRDYVRDTWGVEHGLPQISVLAIVQDQDGYLWLGSQGGLARYDGVRFTPYGQQDAPELGGHVLALHAGNDRLWIGTTQGLLVFRNGRFTRVPLVSAPDQAQGDFPVRTIVAGDDGVLVGGPDGVYASDGTRLTLLHPLAAPAWSLLRHRDGIWVGSTGQVFRLDATGTHSHALPAAAALAQVSRLAGDGDGRLWAGTAQGLYLLEGEAWQRIADTPVEALQSDRDGNLWVASPQRLDRLREGRRVESVVDLPGSRAIRAIHEDRDGNLWLGSAVDGLTRAWDGWTKRLGHEQGLRKALLWSIASGPDGTVHVGGSDGVDSFDGQRFRLRAAGERLPHPEAYTLLVETDRTWIGTRAGVAVLRNGRIESPPVLAPLRGAQVSGIVRDRSGRLWFATSDGLFLLWPDGSLSQYGQAQGLADGRARLVHETRDGRILVGTNRGLYEWRDGGILATGRDTGLAEDTMVTAIHELEDGRWIIGGTRDEQLQLFDGKRWTALGRAQGIPANIAFFIAANRGWLWVAGMRGVYRLPLADLDGTPGRPGRPVHAEIVINSGADRPGGQVDKCCNGAGNARGLLAGDTLWLPTRDGALLVDTARPSEPGVAPRMLIERVQVLGQWQYPDQDRPLQLPLHARDLKFEFSAPSFRPDRPVQLRYRLVGYDRGWREPDAPHLRNAVYTNLPPGDYRFEVADFSAGRPDNVAGMRLSIPPRWHEALVFRLLLPLLLTCLVFIGYEWLQRRHARQRAALEQLVQERTRDLQAANERLETLSFTDPLTGLHNRRYLSRQVPADLAFYQRDAAYRAGIEVVVFALLDLDHFKGVNDTHGHAAGDRVLERTAALLTALVRSGDYVARWGGEEFLLVFRPQPRGSLARIGERLCAEIRGHAFELDDGTRCKLTASVGLVECPLFPQAPHLLGWEQMVTLADRALYRAKADGRNTGAAYRPREDARPPAGMTAFEGDPSWLVETGLLELFRADGVVPDAPAGTVTPR